MSQETEGKFTDLDEATKLLDQMEADAAAQAAKGDQSASGAPRAEQSEEDPEEEEAQAQTTGAAATAAETAAKTDTAGDQSKTKSETPAAGQDKTKVQTDAEKAAAEKAKAEEGKSRFAKAKERLTGGWTELNAGKETLAREREVFAKEKQQLEAAKLEFQAQRDEAEKAISPETYDQAAKHYEEQGKFELAELARQKAEQLRKNPPAKKADVLEGQRKEWALKAGVDFPELSKTNSSLQLRVSQLMSEEPDFKKHPKGIYVAARIASLEAEMEKHKAAAAGVAEKDKEIGRLTEKVKELEALTSAGGAGGSQQLPGEKTYEQMSESEQLDSLRRDAAGVTIR